MKSNFRKHLKKKDTFKKNEKPAQISRPTQPVAKDAPIKKTSVITELSQKPFYIIATLIITLIGGAGGIPGILQLKSYWFDKPELKFYTYSVALWQDQQSGNDHTKILITGIVQNIGERALFIKSGFVLYTTLPSGEKLMSEIVLLNSDTASLNYDSIHVSFSKIRDLQSIYTLSPNDPMNCSALFLVKATPEQIAKPATLFTITCADLSGRNYLDTFYMKPRKQTQPTILPRVNVNISKIKPNDSLQNK
ncbi:MAG TPA: hypothetical protein VFF23_12550 [Hanamia sp.]|nr:hypothetical protein [Hanamia sp.]